jgi:endonuclease YncB( thermonuclease family)
MSNMVSSCRFAARRLTQLRHKVGLIALAIACAAPVDVGGRESKDWIVLENCRLISNPANDGDSFHASAGAKEYIFRLYMVDAPETDEMTPRRLVEQAKYFAITVPQAIEVGRAAKEFTREKLSEPFIIFTHMSDAMGQSRLERFYAFVQTKDGDLGEQLVRNGPCAELWIQSCSAWIKKFAIRARKNSTIRGRSETRENRRMGS